MTSQIASGNCRLIGFPGHVLSVALSLVTLTCHQQPATISPQAAATPRASPPKAVGDPCRPDREGRPLILDDQFQPLDLTKESVWMGEDFRPIVLCTPVRRELK